MSEDQSYQSLKEAIEAGDLDKVKDLVENGQLDLNNPDWEGDEKPLILAVKSRSPNLVEYLIEKGAKVDEAEAFYMKACNRRCAFTQPLSLPRDELSIIQCLLENGADHWKSTLEAS